MKLQNKPFNSLIASGTDNVVVPTESQNREGIQYKSETKSNVPIKPKFIGISLTF